MGRFLATVLGAILACSSVAWAQHGGHDHGGKPQAGSSEVTCQSAALSCATTATPTFAPDGGLWLSYVAAGKVWVARSGDLGQSFSEAVAVPFEDGGLALDNGPDARPKIVVGPDGVVTVAFALRDQAYNGTALWSRSSDGGRSFVAARRLAEGSPSQRFETLALDPKGHVLAVWIDKRNAAAAKKSGQKYAGAALAFTWLREAQASSAAVVAKDNTCECCRIAIAFGPDGQAAVMFRNIFEGGVRDHAVLRLDGGATAGPLLRVSVDDWATDACPHHGPSLAIAETGRLHAVWFTAGKARRGLFYARSVDGGGEFATPMALGGRGASRPYVLVSPGVVDVVWKEFDGEVARVLAIVSRDDGANWSMPRVIAETRGASDHPLLIARGESRYLSWLTAGEGYRLVPLEDKP